MTVDQRHVTTHEQPTATADHDGDELPVPAAEALRRNGVLTNDELEERDERRKRAVQLHQVRESLRRDLGARYAPERLRGTERYHPEQIRVLDRIEKIVPTLHQRIAEGQNVVWFGTVGTGKDHMQATLLYYAANLGITCKRVSGLELYAAARDRMDSDEAEARFIRRWTDPAVLAISDPTPPVGDLNAWRLELLLRVIDARYNELKPMWMTLNAKSAEHAEEKLGSQIWDRLQEGAELIPCFWPSYREHTRVAS
jgi:DNA replication protein DnaC